MENSYISTPWSEWKFISEIGRGSYGVVYKAININSDKYAAIKKIEVSPEKIEKAEKELEILYSLKKRKCKNILSIEAHEIEKHPDKCYIYIRTALLTSLEERFRCDNYNEIEVNRLAIDICHALKVCEEENIIHRDIKPGNILYDEANGNYILCDFGVAREIYEPDDNLTRVGAPGFIAPEVNTGIYDKRADIYSLGMVLYYFANNQNLPKRSEDLSLPPPCNASEKLAKTILKACEYYPDKRHQCVQELIDVIYDPERTTDDINTEEWNGRAPEPPIPQQKTPKPKTPYFISAFLVLILLILLIFLLKACKSSKSIKDNSNPESTISDESMLSSTNENFDDGISENNDDGSVDIISSIITEVESLLEDKKYEEAFDRVQEGIENFPESERLQKVKETINNKINIVHNNDTALTSAKEMAEQGDLISAIRLLEDTKNTSESGEVYDDKLSKAINDYTEKYVDDTLNKVNEYVDANDYSAAMDVLFEVTKQLPNNSTLSSKMSSVKSQKEKNEMQKNTNLYDYIIFNASAENGGFRKVSLLTDNIGTTYTNALENYWYNDEAYNEYYLNKKYKTFTGTVFILDKSMSTERKIPFEIYGDDTLLYSCTLSGGVKPQDFNFSVKDVDILKIKASNVGSITSDTFIGIGNATLFVEEPTVAIEKNNQENLAKNTNLYDYIIFNASAENGGFRKVSLLTDNIGTTYTNALENYWYNDEAYNEYYLNKKYKTFTGTVFILDKSMSTERKIPFEIYGDDTLLYSCTLSGGVKPQDFNFSVKDVDILKIKASNVGSITSDTFIGIGNATLFVE